MGTALNKKFKIVRKNKEYILYDSKNVHRGFVLDQKTYSVLKKFVHLNPAETRFEQVCVNVFKKTGIFETAAPPLKENDREDNKKIYLSVIILNYNGEPHLGECLASLLRQSDQHFEIIIVDNASQDKSVEMIRQNYPDRVKLIELKESVGFSEGNNIGITAATADYYFLLNNDTTVEKDAVSEIKKKIEKLEEDNVPWGAMALKMYLYGYKNVFNSFGVSVKECGFGFDNYLGMVDFGQFDERESVMGASFGAAVLNQKAIGQIGYLDRNYQFYYEDSDWCYRSHLANYKIYTCPRAVVYHKFSGSFSGKKGLLFKLSLAISNRLYFAVKNLRLNLAMKFVFNYAIEDGYNFMKNIILLKFDFVFNYVKGYFRFLLFLLPKALVERRKISKTFKPMDEAEILSLNVDRPLFLKENYILLNEKIIKENYYSVN